MVAEMDSFRALNTSTVGLSVLLAPALSIAIRVLSAPRFFAKGFSFCSRISKTAPTSIKRDEIDPPTQPRQNIPTKAPATASAGVVFYAQWREVVAESARRWINFRKSRVGDAPVRRFRLACGGAWSPAGLSGKKPTFIS
jgi:hypothetical protein